MATRLTAHARARQWEALAAELGPREWAGLTAENTPCTSGELGDLLARRHWEER